MAYIGSSSERLGAPPSEPSREMCKIIITETGRSRKSRAESFAGPHPTPLPLALGPASAPPPPPSPPPPPPPQPSAVVKLAPLPASKGNTKPERDAQKKHAGERDLQKLALHHPKTTAQVPSAKTISPNRTVQIPTIYARIPKVPAQVNAPGKTQAQHKSILAPVTKDSDKEKNAASKGGKPEKPPVANVEKVLSSNGNKKAVSRRVTSTGENGLPEPVKGANVDRNESQTSAENMRESRTNSPLRNVRFVIGESRRTRSTTSSSSSSSEDSFIDPHPYATHTNPHSTGKQSESTPSGRNMLPSYFANMEEDDSMESDDSSNIDAGEALGSRMPWEHTESFRDLGPAKSQPHDVRSDRSDRDGNPASSIPRAARHDHVSAPGVISNKCSKSAYAETGMEANE